MSKDLDPFILSLAQCEKDLPHFRTLLDTHSELSESEHVLPFFREHPQLIALAGSINLQTHEIDRLGAEFDLFGNFRCDWVVGDHGSRAYTLIEFEDARANSVFRTDEKYHKGWGRRFEQGFSQLVDWFWAVDSSRRIPDFERRFGNGFVQFFGMLVVGRRHQLTGDQNERLRWRSDRVQINNHKITCLTFDDLYDFLSRRVLFTRQVARDAADETGGAPSERT